MKILFLITLIACGSGKLAAAGLSAVAGGGEDAAPEQTVIFSDRLDFDYREYFATFIGNVRVDDPRFTLTADRMIVYFEGTNDVREAKASGNVHVTSNDRNAYSDEVFYYRVDERMVMTGNASIVQGRNRLSGPVITIWLRDERVEGKGAVLSVVPGEREP